MRQSNVVTRTKMASSFEVQLGSFFIVLLLTMTVTFSAAVADSIGYYFNFSNELIDLPYPGDTFYGEVHLNAPIDNHLQMNVNAYTSPGENNYLGNFVNSPLVAGPNFGIQQFAFDSTLILTEDDFDTFLSLYDVVIPDKWNCKFNGQVSEFGRFEFVYNGTGDTRQDPLLINISPKDGADLTGYQFSSVMAFVEPNAAGYLFAAHIAGFTTDPAYWDEGFTDLESAYFAVTEDPGPQIPEPTVIVLGTIGLIAFLKRRTR